MMSVCQQHGRLPLQSFQKKYHHHPHPRPPLKHPQGQRKNILVPLLKPQCRTTHPMRQFPMDHQSNQDQNHQSSLEPPPITQPCQVRAESDHQNQRGYTSKILPQFDKERVPLLFLTLFSHRSSVLKLMIYFQAWNILFS